MKKSILAAGLMLVVGASALLQRFGKVVDVIRRDGFEPDAVVHMILEGETPTTMAKSTGLALLELPTIFENLPARHRAHRRRPLRDDLDRDRRGLHEHPRGGLEQMEVDGFGLDHLERRLLTTIIEVYGGGPVGLKALAGSLGEDRGTLEDINEPYLLQIGMLQRTPRGRTATAAAYRHLGLTPQGTSSPLFEGSD